MRRSAPEAFLDDLALDRSAVEPLAVQIARRIRDLVMSGGLRRGVRLPASRRLADALGVSRTTVVAALDILLAEGFVEGRHGSGTFIAADLPADRLAGARRRARPAAGPTLSARGAALAGTPEPPPGLRPFTPGVPSLDAFPFEEWRRSLARAQRLHGRALLSLADPCGWRPLREAIAAHLGPARGVVCDAGQVTILASARQSMALAGRFLADPGERVWIEDPGYPESRAAFLAVGLEPVPVPVDADGIDVAAGRRAAPDARLAFVTPSHQYPLGAVMSLPRRLALLDWARAAGAAVIEDDYDGEFRYGGRPITALYGLDGGDRVLYAGSFSKVMFPALRIAYLIAPARLSDALAASARAAVTQPPTLTQAALAEFMAAGALTGHIRRMRLLYRARRDALVGLLRRHLAGALTVAPAEAGLHLVGQLAPGLDDRAVAAAAAAEGLGAVPLSRFVVGRARPNGLLLGYGAHDAAALGVAVRRLARAIDRAGRKVVRRSR
ncbi:MAG: PLP-dependent aminotransferase family protein [Alphaproteobacteria bacterium]